MPQTIFQTLGIVRIYTRKPQQGQAGRPLISRGETTVEDVAKDIHSEFYKNFKYAKV